MSGSSAHSASPGPADDDRAAPAVRADALVRNFGSRTAVDGLSFQVRAGEIFGLLGHNGAGKTTTIRLLNGVLRPTSGSVAILGMDPVHEGAQVRRRTGVVTETPALDGALTSQENLTVYGRIFEVDEDSLRERVSDLLGTFGLRRVSSLPARQLSLGLKQRLALARALVHDPEILFFDEPTSSMDPLAARRVRSVVADLVRDRGRTVVLCTHNLVEAQELCDRIAILERGRILAAGTMDDLAAELSVSRQIRLVVGAGTAGEAAVTVRSVPGVRKVSSNGASVRVAVDNHDVIPALVHRLAERSFQLYEVVAEERSSLEDLYVALHEREGGDHAVERIRA